MVINMELQEKLKILADSAKYDASCSSSGSTRKNNGMVLVMLLYQEYVTLLHQMVDVFLF